MSKKRCKNCKHSKRKGNFDELICERKFTSPITGRVLNAEWFRCSEARKDYDLCRPSGRYFELKW